MTVDSAFQELLQDFLLEARERLDAVEGLLLSLEEADDVAAALEQARRDLHTLKGNSGMMGFSELQQLAHSMEDQVDELPLQPGSAIEPILAGLDQFRRLLREQAGGDGTEEETLEGEASQELALGSVRVPFTELDALVEMMAEVLMYRTRLADATARTEQLLPGQTQQETESWEELENVRLHLEQNLDLVQDRVLKLRMVPMQSLFRHLNRIVHDESVREGKRVRLAATGGNTPLDKALLELASEALGHLVRNAVIHGIEMPDQREKAGKNPEGIIELSASVHAQEVHIQIQDDGGGIDRETLKGVAKRLGREVKNDKELEALLFEAGVSTKEGADLSAGRGIGLSAVAEAVRRQGGRVEVTSRPGEGTRFLLRLPLSVSITRALLFRADGEEYAVPLGAVVESLRFGGDGDGGGETLHGSRVFRWRGELLPIQDLGKILGTRNGDGTNGAPSERQFAIVLEALGRHQVLTVDEITGIRDIVVKGVDSLVAAPDQIAGSTILGDGRVILILDPTVLVESGVES
jgi:two-component system chemotaxis sensor kinase CheA